MFKLPADELEYTGDVSMFSTNTMSFYTRDLSICEFWYLRGSSAHLRCTSGWLSYSQRPLGQAETGQLEEGDKEEEQGFLPGFSEAKHTPGHYEKAALGQIQTWVVLEGSSEEEEQQ